MPRIYHYDTTYEQEAEDGTITASVELRIYYTVTPGGVDSMDGPGWPEVAEFYDAEAEIGSSRKYRELVPAKSTEDHTLYWWAQDFVEKHQDVVLEAADCVDEMEEEYAREMRDDLRAEQRREDRS